MWADTLNQYFAIIFSDMSNKISFLFKLIWFAFFVQVTLRTFWLAVTPPRESLIPKHRKHLGDLKMDH